MNNQTNQPFVPVILGGNRGAYGLARAFYEAYGIPSVVIGPVLTGPVNHSTIIQFYQLEEMSDWTSFQAVMQQIDAANPAKDKLLFGSDDCYVSNLISWRSRFYEHWLLPYVDEEVYQSVTDKTQFYELCERVGVPYPRTVVLQAHETDYLLSFPIIIKPAQTPMYQALSFKGKQKVYLCKSREEAAESIALMRMNDYHGELILQEYIAGDDTSLGIITAYVAKKDRQLKLLSYAKVLVDDPTPSAIGNSLACVTEERPELTAAVQNIFAATDFWGFATFDVKYDARSKQYVFFELNGRLGSSNYYVTAAGNNVAEYYIEDVYYKRALPQAFEQKKILYNLLPAVYPATKNGKVVHPLAAAYEIKWQRKAYIFVSKANYCLKLLKYTSLEKAIRKSEKKKLYMKSATKPFLSRKKPITNDTRT